MSDNGKQNGNGTRNGMSVSSVGKWIAVCSAIVIVTAGIAVPAADNAAETRHLKQDFASYRDAHTAWSTETLGGMLAELKSLRESVQDIRDDEQDTRHMFELYLARTGHEDVVRDVKALQKNNQGVRR